MSQLVTRWQRLRMLHTKASTRCVPSTRANPRLRNWTNVKPCNPQWEIPNFAKLHERQQSDLFEVGTYLWCALWEAGGGREGDRAGDRAVRAARKVRGCNVSRRASIEANTPCADMGRAGISCAQAATVLSPGQPGGEQARVRVLGLPGSLVHPGAHFPPCRLQTHHQKPQGHQQELHQG